MDQIMNLENLFSSLARTSASLTYLDNSLDATEQSFLNISIKDEPLDIPDNDSSEGPSYAYSKNIVEKGISKQGTEEKNDNAYTVTCFNTLIKVESNADATSDSDNNTRFVDIDNNLTGTGLDNENKTTSTAVPMSDIIFNEVENSYSELDDLETLSVDQNIPVSQEPENSFADSLLLEDNTFSCSLCSFTTDRKTRLNDHERNHRKSNLPIVQCFYCSQRYTRYMLYLHIVNVHPGQKFQIRDENTYETKGQHLLYQCPTCPFSTSNQGSLTLHMKTHVSEKNKLTHKCSTCPFTTSNRGNLTLHMRKHSSEKVKLTYKCSICPFTTSNRGNLPFHMRKHSSEEKKSSNPSTTRTSPETDKDKPVEPAEDSLDPEVILKCSFCSFSTVEPKTLKRHIETHLIPIKSTEVTGQHIFTCGLCSYNGHHVDIQRHIEAHRNNRPIEQCIECDFKSTPSALLHHRKKCNGTAKSASTEHPESMPRDDESDRVVVKSFKKKETTKISLKCKSCSFSTTDNSRLTLHIKKHLFDPVRRLNSSRQKMHYCKMCSYSCRKLSTIIGHINSHKTNLAILKCPRCSFKSTPQALFYHRKKCRAMAEALNEENSENVLDEGETDYSLSKSKKKGTPKTSMKCKTCSFSTTNRLKLKLHTKKHLFEPVIRNIAGHTEYYCKMCSYGCRRIAAIIRHINSHKNNSITKCTKCKFKSTPQALFYHNRECQKTTDSASEKKSESISRVMKIDRNSVTSKKKISSAKLKIRVNVNKRLYEPVKKRINSSGRALYYCKLCSYGCTKLSATMGHIKSHKKNLPIIRCTKCDFRSTPRVIKFHLRKCQVSLRSVTTGTTVGSNSENVSSGTGFKCAICAFTTTKNREFIKTHIKETHEFGPDVLSNSSGDKIYQCRVCSFNSKYMYKIQRHCKSHERNLPISSCSYCDFRSTSVIVKFHMRECKVNGKSATVEVTNNVLNDENSQKSSETGTVASATSLLTTNKPKKVYTDFKPDILTNEVGRKTYKCKNCSYVSKKYKTMIGHTKSHVKNLPMISCPNCNFKSTSKAVKFHLMKCTRNSNSTSLENTRGSISLFACPKCPFNTSLRIKLKLHIRKRHLIAEQQEFSCKLCSFATKDGARLNLHMKGHARNLPIKKCLYCSFKSTCNVLRRHVREHNSQETIAKNLAASSEGFTEIYKCQFCSFSTHNSKYFNGHMSTHVQSKAKKSSTTKNCKTRHAQNKSSKVYKCKLCSFVTLTSSGYYSHSATHAQKQAVKKCPKCNFKSTPGALSKHISREKHYRGFKCQFCSLICRYSKCLDKHMKSHKTPEPLSHVFDVEESTTVEHTTGNDDSNFVLTEVGDANSKDDGERTKTEGTSVDTKKPLFRCPECSFSFYLRIKLKAHLEKYHSKLSSENLTKPDEASYTCDFCSYTTINKYQFAKHMRTLHLKSAKQSSNTIDLDNKTKILGSENQLTNKKVGNKTLFTCSLCTFSSIYKHSQIRHMERHVENSRESSRRQSDLESTEQSLCNDNIVDEQYKVPSKIIQKSVCEIGEIGQNQKKLSSTDEEEIFMTSPGMYACSMCSYTSAIKGSILRHKGLHRKNFPIGQCPNSNCSYKSTSAALSLHVQKCPYSSEPNPQPVSQNLESYECHICSYTTTSCQYLKQHLNAHGFDGQPVKKCSRCDFKATRSLLEKHGPICPNRSQPKELLNCSQCSFTTYWSKKLAGHEIKNHIKKKIKTDISPKSFKCEYCSFTSFWQYLVERHLNSHTLLKLPIEKCKRCEFRSTPAALLAHMNRCIKSPDVSANSPPRKLKRSDIADCIKTDSNKLGKSKDQNQVRDTKCNEIVKTISFYSSKNDLELETRGNQAMLPESNMEKQNTVILYPHNLKTDTAKLENYSGSLANISTESSPKTEFECPKCSFSTRLRIKLKFHVEKNH